MALITVNWKEKLEGILVKKLKIQAKLRKKLKSKSKKTSKNANSSWDDLPKKRPNKTPAFPQKCYTNQLHEMSQYFGEHNDDICYV